VVLFDEPLGSLDLKLRREMQIEIKNIQRHLGTTFVNLTHDQHEVLNMCDRIAKDKIAQGATAEEIYERPRTRFIADSIGDTNFLDGKVRTGKLEILRIRQNLTSSSRNPDTFSCKYSFQVARGNSSFGNMGIYLS